MDNDHFLTGPSDSMETEENIPLNNNHFNNNNNNNNAQTPQSTNFFIDDGPYQPTQSSETHCWPEPENKTEHPLNKYILGVELGRGSCGIVRKVLEKSTQQYYALKSVPKKFVSRMSWLNLTREIEIMLNVNHPNVIKLKEIIDTQTHLHIVLEFMSGGELFGKIVSQKKKCFNERDASQIVKQILAGVAYLHELGIAHRDLKPENLLCDSTVSRVVVADFGLAKIFSRGELLQTACGTKAYAAPEVLLGNGVYSNACDMWSVGVITYILLCGHFPFSEGSAEEDHRNNITNGVYSFPDSKWGHISEAAKNFIRKCLTVDQEQRITANAALLDPWVQGEWREKSTLDLSGSLDNWNSNRLPKNLVHSEDVMEF